ncbi:hypothetical protein SUGI_0505090 [Cryptomeria japonica]|uniref:uncharacterized protein LOC131036068 n=1 Tax=Cryptomeria japonica TaxID=3369 RepID=UPI002408E7BE|nr:uncharacterized protein LOC131036068 [Cryptomeria japonica]GLJ26277.1 hypothetical protein SUGI_0505090 [Cryptomeria japonica]
MASSETTSTAPYLPIFSPPRDLPLIGFDLAKSVLSPKTNLQSRSPVPSVPPKSGQRAAVPSVSARKTCLCSPSNHPGAFRCSLHRNCPPSSSSASTIAQLHMRRSAMKNSLVRIGSVEGGEWMKKALIRPSSREVRRRASFHPQPSRLRHMTTAEDAAVS